MLTADAVSLAEIKNRRRARVYAMALSATDSRDRGRPSAWSGALDSLAADALGENAFPRLFTIAAGNTGDDLTALATYPDPNLLQDIHDPGQAWNTLTVGAYTAKVLITEPECADYRPLAPSGGLSPYSTTSQTWQSTAPLKPDVVFEGGNVGVDNTSCAGIPSLKLLTTFHRPLERLFTTFEATSAATALASRFAALIRAEYPDLWPETVRALIVHSADWTAEMCRQLAHGKSDRQQARQRVRCVGFGAPDLDRALWSAPNSLALIVEDRLQPFEKAKAKIATRDMHLHDLPWPKDVLQDLGNLEVELVVTLSYFIEPNPSSRNVAGQYSYASHQLRFDVKRPLVTRNPIPAQGLHSQRHLAWQGGRDRRARTDRRLPSDGLVAHADQAQTLRQGNEVRLDRVHPRARSRCGHLQRGGHPNSGGSGGVVRAQDHLLARTRGRYARAAIATASARRFPRDEGRVLAGRGGHAPPVPPDLRWDYSPLGQPPTCRQGTIHACGELP